MADLKKNNIRILILCGLIAAALLLMIIENFADPWLVIAGSGLFLLSVAYRNAAVYPSRQQRFSRLIYLADIFLVFLISKFDQGSGSLFFYLVIVADVSISCSFLFSSGITLLAFTAFAAERIWSQDFPPLSRLLPAMVFYLLAFLATQAILYLVNDEIQQKSKLNAAMDELKVKTKLLENACQQLREASHDLEEMAALKERNEIAREVHDTVGHTLTTILLEMEAGVRLVKHDPEQAIAKIQLASGQVRQGLADLRRSVRAMQSGPAAPEFIPSLRSLIEQTMANGQIHIRADIGNLPALTAQQEKVLFRALQEGITNGVKHGGSTAFVFILKYADQHISFFLQDNGCGTGNIVYGFGLSAMAERVKEVQGSMAVSSQPGEGLAISINLPYSVYEVVRHEDCQCPDCR